MAGFSNKDNSWIANKEWSIGAELAHGAFGTVHKGYYHS